MMFSGWIIDLNSFNITACCLSDTCICACTLHSLYELSSKTPLISCCHLGTRSLCGWRLCSQLPVICRLYQGSLPSLILLSVIINHYWICLKWNPVSGRLLIPWFIYHSGVTFEISAVRMNSQSKIEFGPCLSIQPANRYEIFKINHAWFWQQGATQSYCRMSIPESSVMDKESL